MQRHIRVGYVGLVGIVGILIICLLAIGTRVATGQGGEPAPAATPRLARANC